MVSTILEHFVVGRYYEFKSETHKRKYVEGNRHNKRIADAISVTGSFAVVSGRNRAEYSDTTDVVGEKVYNAEKISINGEVFNTDDITPIGTTERQYFQCATSKDERLDIEFKSIRFETLIDVFMHYNPGVAESKITMSSLRKCWKAHKENIEREQIKINDEIARIEQMKVDLENLKKIGL